METFSYFVRGDNKHVVTVGTLKSAKAHDILIRAFRTIVDEWNKATLTIVGDGPRRREYEDLADDLGLSQNLHITGWKSPKEVKKVLQKASVFAFPSRSEGFGIALAEAMATGLPVVVSTAGGIPEVIGEAKAKIVKPDSASELATALREALRDEKWRNEAGAASRRRASNFSWETVINEYEEVFELSSL